MSSDVEYLLLKDKGQYHEVYVRRRLNSSPGTCKFYTIVISIITISLLLLLLSLIYVFVLLPSWQGKVLSWDGRPEQEARIHVLTHTQCGLVEGKVEEGVYSFKGIPYALAPVGSRRWKPPEMMSHERGNCWSGTYQAKKFGSVCVQPKSFNTFTNVEGSEDCLFLNVWTQSLDPLANQPVMFWIHGGSLVHGSGNMATMKPTPEVTKSTHAVYVSINYRLGALGFLTLGTLSQNSSSRISGNYGFMDVILALEWVRDNIRNFGGNPHKVTVFGQSSGGTLIHGLLASPRASGLFHRAWLASASAILNKTVVQASRDNMAYLNLTQCSNVDCLRRLSASQVIRKTPWTQFPFWGMHDLFGMPVKGRFDGALVVVDGLTLKEPPIQAWKYGRGNHVPTMFTTTAQEMDVLPFDPTISSWTWQHYKATVMEQLTPFCKDIAQMALELYPADPSLTPEYQYTTMVSDIRMNCPNNMLANVASGGFRSPVYRGVVTAIPSSPVNLYNVSSAHYAFHGWDLAVFFGDFKSFSFHPKEKDMQFQKVLREQMMAFVRNGRPETPVWDTARTCTALLSDHVFPVEHYSKDRCDFWMKHGFFSYAAIN